MYNNASYYEVKFSRLWGFRSASLDLGIGGKVACGESVNRTYNGKGIINTLFFSVLFFCNTFKPYSSLSIKKGSEKQNVFRALPFSFKASVPSGFEPWTH